MRTTETRTDYRRAVGLFPTQAEARDALYKLRDSGFNMDQISIIAQSGEGVTNLTDSNQYDSAKSNAEQAQGGAGAGAVAGAVAGGVIGLVGSLGVLAVPAVGVGTELGIILGNTLLGSGIGAAGGGLVGALIGWGVPEEQANFYNDRVYNHNEYLVMVEGTEQEIRAAEKILQSYGLRDWNIFSATHAEPSASRTRRL
jgi:hypothetical protein